MPKIKQLQDRVHKTIRDHPDRLGISMNSFVIAVGSYVKPLSDVAIAVAKEIGEIERSRHLDGDDQVYADWRLTRCGVVCILVCDTDWSAR